MYCPRLPWDVLESVIDLSRGRPNTLCSLALTCRHLRRPSHLAIFGRIQLESSDHVFAFIAFLEANPELRPFVHTLVATPAALGPSPLYVLPNLSSIECVDESQLEEPEDEDSEDEDQGYKMQDDETPTIPNYTCPQTRVRVRAQRSLVVHLASLACFTRLGARVRSLRLSSVSFPTLLSFTQMLVAFASITRLVCEDVEIEGAGNKAPLEVATQRLAEQIQLKELLIDSYSLGRGDDVPCPGALLFDARLAPSVIESLVVEDPFPYQADWRQLQRLVLQFSSETTVVGATDFLEKFPDAPRLKDLLIEWRGWSRKRIVEELSRNVDDSASNPAYQAFTKLNHALLRFPHPTITFIVASPVDARTLSFWAGEIGSHLPLLLADGGTIRAECSEALVPSTPPHHDGVQALVVSPDSKWVASGSLDSTISLWDAASGTVVRRWVPHRYRPVRSLAFSPNSQYLVSGGDDGKAAVWDLGGSQSVCAIAMLEGHVGLVLACAWSPDGNTIVTGSEDGTARLWDAHTTACLQRALVRLKGAVVCFEFSQDGAWLACGSNRGSCCIVNVASGCLRRSLWNTRFDSQDVENGANDDIYSGGSQTPHQMRDSDTIVAFDPTRGSTRLATAPCGSCSGINTVDVKTGSILAHMGGKMGELMRMRDVSFSPDGRLVLGVSAASSGSRTGVYVWDAATGVERFKLTGRDAVCTARFSPCRPYVAVGAMDRTVQVWKINGGSCECMATLSGHGAAVEHVAFSPDGKTLASGARDGTVVIRHMRDLVPV